MLVKQARDGRDYVVSAIEPIFATSPISHDSTRIQSQRGELTSHGV